ncbi:MAG TPA: WYL domain-containing protein [Paraburkholderia sp.]|nr:WYL domain-containing protein [Paraburkholderia sp.]
MNRDSKVLDEAILKVLPTNQRDIKWMSTANVRDILEERGHNFRYLKKLRRRLEAMEEARMVVSTQEDGKRDVLWQRTPWLANDMAARMDSWDAVAFSMLERFAARRLPKAVFKDVDELFRVAEMRLSQERDDNRLHRAWADKVDSVDGTFALIRPKVKDDVFSAITTAMFFERVLDVRYESPLNRGKERPPLRIWPLALVESTGLMYIVVQLDPSSVKPGGAEASDAGGPKDEKKKGKREKFILLRADRILSAKEVPSVHGKDVSQTFVYPDDFKLRSFIDNEQRFNFLVEPKVRIRIAFDGSAGNHLLEESRISTDQTSAYLDDGRLVVGGTVVPSLKLRWWLRSFGDTVEVLEPQSLRDEFAETYRKLAARYQ